MGIVHAFFLSPEEYNVVCLVESKGYLATMPHLLDDRSANTGEVTQLWGFTCEDIERIVGDLRQRGLTMDSGLRDPDKRYDGVMIDLLAPALCKKLVPRRFLQELPESIYNIGLVLEWGEAVPNGPWNEKWAAYEYPVMIASWECDPYDDGLFLISVEVGLTKNARFTLWMLEGIENDIYEYLANEDG